MNATMLIVTLIGTVLFCGVGVPLIINWLFDKFGR